MATCATVNASAALIPSEGAAAACDARPSYVTPKCATALMRERLYPERLAYRWDVLWQGAARQTA